MAIKRYTPLTLDAIRVILALKAQHEIQSALEDKYPDCPLVKAGGCALSAEHYALQKGMESRNFDPDEVAQLMGGWGGK